MSRIFLVRHGDTFLPGEPPRRIGAATDLPLVDSGRMQAAALRAHFIEEGVRFERAFASPLRRTMETAAALLAGTGVSAETASWLAEIDHGPDEGRLEAEILARVGADALRAWDRDALPPPGWSVDGKVRISAWRSILSERATANGAMLAVTSNGAARFALLADPELRDKATALASLKLRTGAFGRLDFVDGHWQIAAWDVRPSPGCARVHAVG